APKQHLVRLWPLSPDGKATSAAPRVCAGHKASIRVLAMSADGRWLATADEESSARIWDLSAKDPAGPATALLGHEEAIHTAAFSADGRWLITGAADETVRLWSLGPAGPQTMPVVLRPGHGPICIVTLSPDGHWLITAGEDNTAQVHNLRIGEWIELGLQGKVGESDDTASQEPAPA